MINPTANKTNSSTDRATLTLRDMTVRLDLPRSLTRKNRPLPRLTRMPSMTKKMKALYILTGDTAGAGMHEIKAAG